MRPRPLHTAAALLALAAPAAASAAAPPVPLAAFSLAAPRDQVASGLIARAVVPAGAGCPDLVADGRRLRMRWRQPAAGTGAAFASLMVCERALPPGARSARVGASPVPAAMPASIARVALLGDSGCRIAASQVQDCVSPDGWPFARIARRVADARPDAIVFLGDLFYREAACPVAQTPLCGGSPPPLPGAPFTDGDFAWQADVLNPMSPMFAAAPIVMVRGNHEACSRGGNGWFLLFDPRPGTAGWCAPQPGPGGRPVAPQPGPTPSYAVDLPVSQGRVLRLVVADSADGSDTAVTPAAVPQRAAYRAAAALASPARGREAWLLTHRPIFAHVTTDFSPGTPGWTPWTSVDQQAASAGLLGRYRLILSSHLHLAQAVQIPGVPGQLTLGNAGTLLDPPTGYATPLVGPLTDPRTGQGTVPGIPPYPAPVMDWTDVRFGYAMARPGSAAGGWDLTLRDDAGAAVAACTLAGARLECTPSS